MAKAPKTPERPTDSPAAGEEAGGATLLSDLVAAPQSQSSTAVLDAPPTEMNDPSVQKVEGDKDAAGVLAAAAGLQGVLSNVDDLSSRWQKRLAKEGVKKLVCPLDDPGPDRPEFDTIKQFEAYTKKKYPLQWEQAKLTKTPIAPKIVVHSPKRGPLDVYPAHMASVISRQKPVNEETKKLMNQARSAMGGDKSVATGFVTGMFAKHEHEIIAQLSHLSTTQLQELGGAASTSGRTHVARMCRKQLTARNTKPNW